MKGKLLFFIVFFLSSFNLHAQQFFASTVSGLLEQVTLAPNGLVSQDVTGCGTGTFYSIAIIHDKIYFNTNAGDLYVADLTSGANPAISNCRLISAVVSGNALTVDENGILYYVNGYVIYSIDPNNPVPVLLGTLPYSSAGDLVFYNGQLYMAAPKGIVKVNLQAPSKSTLYIPIGSSNIHGLTTLIVNGITNVYALATAQGGTNLLQLDMQNKVLKGVVGTLPYQTYDAGSESEDGNPVAVKIDSINVAQLCGAFNECSAKIVCSPVDNSYTYSLDNGQKNTTGIFDGLPPGTYKLNVTTTDPNIQAKDTSFTVPDFSRDGPAITAVINDQVCGNPGQIKLDAGSDDTAYNIQYGASIFGFGHVFTGLGAGTYHFIILTAKGCIAAEKDYTVQQQDCPVNNVFPNSFTPNNDGINDIFRPYQSNNLSSYKLLIYNRLGMLLFRSDSMYAGWDGNYNGKPVPAGTYYYIATYKMPDNKYYTASGYIALIR